MDDLLNEFIAETREMLEALGGEIVAWEAAPADRARLDAIFRFVHTVKGNSGFFDLPRLQKLSHAAEDVLADVRAGRRTPDAALVDAVLNVIDRIGEMVETLETGEPLSSADDEPLLLALKAGKAAAPAPDEPQAAAGEVRQAIRSIRLPVDLLDRLMSGVSDTVLARNELARALRGGSVDPLVEAAFERLSACIGQMREAVTRTRMQRIDNLFVALPRMVRDLCASLGKRVALEVDGGDVELDREMLEMIRDPLTHIVRNAIDHGIEPEDERKAAGKAETGLLRIAARQSGNQILIEIRDDGRGIDGERLVRKAVASGALTEERAQRLSPADRVALIFEPGLSTASEVSAVSGRGVGMDVVRANIERIGGRVDVESVAGEGVRLMLCVPLTLTIIPALTVGSGGRSYAIPRSAIDEIVRTKSAFVRVDAVGGAQVATIRDRRLPLVSLGKVLGAGESAQEEATIVVLKPTGGNLYALAVEQVHDHEELVVKPAAPAVMSAGIYAGVTLADDGSPILLLDPTGIASRAHVAEPAERQRGQASAAELAPEQEKVTAIHFKGLSGELRMIRMGVVERIEDVKPDAVQMTAGRFHVVLGDRILPLAGCGVTPPDGPFRVFRMSDGSAELAYGVSEVIDIVEIGKELSAAPLPGEIAGVTLHGGKQVEVVDPYWLFESYARASQPDRQPVCAVSTVDPWMANILAPILERAGYRVVLPNGSEQPDVLLAAEEEIAVNANVPVLRIRAAPTRQDEAGESVYRYDREGLLKAVKRLTAEGKRA